MMRMLGCERLRSVRRRRSGTSRAFVRRGPEVRVWEESVWGRLERRRRIPGFFVVLVSMALRWCSLGRDCCCCCSASLSFSEASMASLTSLMASFSPIRSRIGRILTRSRSWRARAEVSEDLRVEGVFLRRVVRVVCKGRGE